MPIISLRIFGAMKKPNEAMTVNATHPLQREQQKAVFSLLVWYDEPTV